MLEDSFSAPINSDVYYKNFDYATEYVGWFYDDSSERKYEQRKFLQPSPNDSSLRQGDYIHWGNHTWICLGMDTQYDYKLQGMIYQCLDYTMNWIDENGFHSFPFYSESKVLRDPLSDGRAIPIVEDTMEAYVQKNEETISIFENLRFAFGARTIFQVIQNIDYYIDNTIKLVLKKDEARPEDDFVNHIAMNTNIEIPIEPTNTNGIVGIQKQLIGKVLVDGVEDISKTLTWSSSDTNIATVNLSGLLTFVSIGTCSITANYNGVINSIIVECISVPILDIEYILSPSTNKITVGENIDFNVEKYIDGILTPTVFSVVDLTLATGYVFTQTGDNVFNIKNIEDDNLDIVLEFSEGVNTFEKTYRLRMW